MSDETVFLYDKVDKLEDEITYLRDLLANTLSDLAATISQRDRALKILEEWTETCAQICDNSYELTVRAKELRFPTPCAGCAPKVHTSDVVESKSSKSIEIVEIPTPQDDEEDQHEYD